MTPREALTAAIAKVGRANASRIALDTEGLGIYTRAMRALFAFGARFNPEFFGDTKVVPFAAPGWPRPADAELIFRVESAPGAEVIIVPFHDRAADPATPAIYPFGQVFRPAGNPVDPTGGNLTFYFARRAQAPANLDAAPDSFWPEGYDELLLLEIAMTVAIKDGRAEDVAALKPDRDRWAVLYAAFLEHETVIERARWRRYRSEFTVATEQLLAGGATL